VVHSTFFAGEELVAGAIKMQFERMNFVVPNQFGRLCDSVIIRRQRLGGDRFIGKQHVKIEF